MNSRATLKTAALAGLLGAAVLLLHACLLPVGDGEGLNTSGDIPLETVTFADVQSIFSANCTECHAPGGPGYTGTGGANNDGLDLTEGNSYESLVDMGTFQASGSHPVYRVRPGSPDSSYLYRKILEGPFKEGASTGPGVRMPMLAEPLSDDDINTIMRWIELGASDD